MCGLIGIVANKGSKFPSKLLTRMAKEAQIRGQHATGAAWMRHQKIYDNSLSTPAEFFPFDLIHEDTSAAIVHTRYSTSDLSHNQPMLNVNINENWTIESALIHNGVVSQAPPEQWESEFGVHCGGRNDSEILAKLYDKGEHPLLLRDTSQACLLLDAKDNTLRFWRNEQRPLYVTINEDYIAVASTKDILYRSGALKRGFEAKPCYPCSEYKVDLNTFTLSHEQIRLPVEDLQN